MFGFEGWRKQKVDPTEVAERAAAEEIQETPVPREEESGPEAHLVSDQEAAAIADQVEKDETAVADDDDEEVGWKHAA